MLKEYLSQLASELASLFEQLSNTTSLVFWLLILLVVLVIVLDAFSTIAQKKRKTSGVNLKIDSVLSPSSFFKETKEYISERQLLSARPDALLVEGGYIIPVERKPLANKIRDRFVVELLVSMRLIEELEGKKPPYGYLILGKKARSVKILNTQKKQQWLDRHLMEMRQILDEDFPVKPTPEERKCQKCLVREHCEYKISSNIK